MSDKSNKYGYVGVDIPAQSFGNNKGVFNPAEINELVANNQWTSFGQLELIETQTASADSSVDFINLATNSYNVYFVTVNDLQTSASSQSAIRFSNNNGSSFIASSYQYAYQRGSTAGTFAETRSTSVAQLNLGLLSTNLNSNSSASGYIYLYNLLDSAKYSFCSFQNFSEYTTGDTRFAFGSGVYPIAETHNAFQIVPSAGTISGNFSLYGIRYS
jgi:hypothetical protein